MLLERQIKEFNFFSTRRMYNLFLKQLALVDISESQLIKFLNNHQVDYSIDLRVSQGKNSAISVILEDGKGKKVLIGTKKATLTIKNGRKEEVYRLCGNNERLLFLELRQDDDSRIEIKNRRNFSISLQYKGKKCIRIERMRPLEKEEIDKMLEYVRNIDVSQFNL